MTTENRRHGVLKGTVAAAAGVAVLLGGAGTFALWNKEGAIGTGSTGTGKIEATFGQTTWQDTTSGAPNAIDDITAFRMVPGDTLVGTADVDVTAVGENLLVDPGLEYEEGVLPDDVTAEVKLTDSDGGTVTELKGTNGGKTYDLTATVTLTFDDEATGSMTETIDLSEIKVNLKQRLN